MAFTVPPLPYSFDALEPHIDAKTMEIHHDKHHGAYVTNLNKALEGHADLAGEVAGRICSGISIPSRRTFAPPSATTPAAIGTTRCSGRR